MTNIDFTYSQKKNNNYYGSDLNRLIDERCTRKMTCNNLDCVLVKVSQRKIRFIESKHINEGSKKGQQLLLDLLSQMNLNGWGIESYLVRGEYPYETASVLNIKTKETRIMNQQQLILWLNFEGDWD